MSDIHIGQTIAYLRKLRNLSQQQLADGICTREYIRKLENGLSQPTIYIIDLLSQKLQEDIYNYHHLVEKHNNIQTHIKIQEINDILASENYGLLDKTVKNYEVLSSFQEGEALQIIYYSKALCAYYLKEDYKEAINFCISGLSVYKHDFDINTWTNLLYSKIELKFINSIASCKCYNEDIENGIKMFYELLEYLDKYVLGTLYSIRATGNFHITLYTQVAYNLSIHLFKKAEYSNAIEVIDKAITISLRTKFMSMYPYLLKNKFQLLYMLGDIEKSKIYYNKSLIYYEDLVSASEALKLAEETKVQYPMIF